MKFWVVLDGRDAEVEARAENGHVVLEVEGRTLEADFLALPDGEVYSLLVNGKHHEVRIAPEAIDPEDPEMLGDMVLAAANEALRAASQAVEAKLRSQMPDLGALGFAG